MIRKTIQERVDDFLSGELRWSISTKDAEKILPLVKKLAKGKYYSRGERNRKFTHFYTKSIPHWEIRNSDIRQLKKFEKQLTKEEILKEREDLKK